MRVQVRGPHPLRPGIQPGSPDTWFSATAGRPVGAGARDPATPRAQPPTGITRARFGHHPLSLATTHRISVDFSSSPYLDVSVQAVPRVRLFDSTHADRVLLCRVSPFGNLRVKAYVQLTAAYRSLSRPSSAPDAKAFPLRSF